MFGSSDNKPSAMEQMVAKMLGFTPDQMQETINSFRDTILSVAASLKRIEDKQDLILEKLEAMDNDIRERNASGGSRSSGGRRRIAGGSGDATGDTTIAGDA